MSPELWKDLPLPFDSPPTLTMSGRDKNARLEPETYSTLELVQNDQAANARLIMAEDQLQIPEYVHLQRRFDDVGKEVHDNMYFTNSRRAR